MINAILYILFMGVFFAIWSYIRTSATTNSTWKALKRVYPTSETEQSLSGTTLDIVFYYMSGEYMKRIYRFYSTSEGLLIRPKAEFMAKEYVLIPWDEIQAGDLR